MEAEGDYEKFMGVVQKRYGNAKDQVRDWTDDWYSRHEQDEIRRRQATTSPHQT
jgi:hypothetical protein